MKTKSEKDPDRDNNTRTESICIICKRRRPQRHNLICDPCDKEATADGLKTDGDAPAPGKMHDPQPPDPQF